jgi:NADH-quinone oxidoreductase subunit G
MNVITVNEENFSVNNLNQTIYQFLYSINRVMPCFCYHEKLTIAGNCRMCLVEANGALVASCAMPLVNKMKINTFSNRVIHARESVLEFLLINHPLDCPVCDQGGECDLQDIGRTYGIDRGRFYENKRSVDNLTCFGPMVKTIMTRCIHCTRCVRFLNEYCDEYQLGVLGRGSSMEIGTYVNAFISHELCANIIDICPVGALTSMPYAFTARP